MSFQLRKSSIAGVDIDYGELRVVELGGRRNAPELLSWGRVQLPAEAVEGGVILQPQAVGDALERLWNEQRIKSRDVIFGVSNQSVIVRFATFPQVPEGKLQNMIRYQARDFLPVSLENSIMDFSVVSTVNKGKEKLLEVLLVVAQRELINHYITVCNLSKLRIRDIHVTSLALTELLPAGAPEGATAILSLGNGASNFLLTAEETPRLARYLSSGLKEAAEKLGCSLEEVVQQAGAGPGEPFPDVFVDWAEAMVGEVRSSIQYYQSQPEAVPVVRLILLGRGARIKGFAGQMEKIFGIPVSLADPMQLLKKVPHNCAGFLNEGTDYGVAFALARGGLGE